MLRLNYMLSNRMFGARQTLSDGTEQWLRRDARVTRYYVEDAAGLKQRRVKVERLLPNGTVFSTEDYPVDDIAAYRMIENLKWPTSAVMVTTHMTENRTLQTIEEICEQAAKAFDKWYQSVAHNVTHDISTDAIVISFGDKVFSIPLWSVDMMGLTQGWLDDMHACAKENQY